MALPRNIPNAIVLKTLDHLMVGGLLPALRPTANGDEFAGECCFMFMPQAKEVIESELGILVSEFRVTGEHPCRATFTADGLEVYASGDNLPTIKAVMSAEGIGHLFAVGQDGARKIGYVEDAAK